MRTKYRTPNRYRVQDQCAHIELTDRKGRFVAEAIIDINDLPHILAVGRWYAARTKSGLYATGQSGRLLLHRFLLGVPANLEVDHINRNTLDCRRQNLRTCSHGQNMQNRRTNRASRTGYRNVLFDPRRGKWEVGCKVNGRRIRAGSFTDIEEAVAAAKALRERLMSHATD